MSVLGTGRTRLTLATFLGNRRLLFLTRLATFIPHVFVLMIPVLNKESTPTLCPPLPIGGEHSRFRHCITACSGAGISTCCPSTTPVGLALGPDLPWEDEPCPGNLSQLVKGILTLYRYLRRHSRFCTLHHSSRYGFTANRTLPYHEFLGFIRDFGITLSPGKFSARRHLTSELLRIL